jgi:hypothetical protein
MEREDNERWMDGEKRLGVLCVSRPFLSLHSLSYDLELDDLAVQLDGPDFLCGKRE